MSTINSSTKMTENDALSYVQSLGLNRESFSDADWSLYETDPDRFSSIANYKIAYSKAASSEEKNQIHTATERLRQEAGYSGGSDGTGYYMTAATPTQFTYDEAPTFSYDMENDEVYQTYKNQYIREGQRAAADAVGSAAATTGGIASSYASTAAAQAGNYYAAQLSDKVPELYDAAYSRFTNDLGQYNTDRGFAYNQYMDNIDHTNTLYNRQWEEAAQKAAVGDYSGYEALGVDIENNPLVLQQQQTQWEQEQALWEQQQAEQQQSWKESEADRQYTLQLAQMALDSGDYTTVYNLLGIQVNTNDITAKEKLQAALFKAEMGDYTWLNQMMNGQF